MAHSVLKVKKKNRKIIMCNYDINLMCDVMLRDPRILINNCLKSTNKCPKIHFFLSRVSKRLLLTNVMMICFYSKILKINSLVTIL